MKLEDLMPTPAMIRTAAERAEILGDLAQEISLDGGQLERAEQCPVCGDPRCTPFAVKHFAEYVRCAACGTVYQAVKLRESLRDAFYARSPYFNVTSEGFHVATHNLRKTAKCGPILDRLIPYADPGTELAILDIGCATGFFLELVSERTAWKAVGVEINEGAAAFARSRGLDVRTGNVMDVGFPPESFDIVTGIGLLGRIAEPTRFMRHCRELLRPDGLLLLTTPNCSGFEMAVLGGRHVYFDPLDTPCGYTRQSIRILLERAGFNVKSMITPGRLDLAIIRQHVRDLELPVELNAFEQDLLFSEEPGMAQAREEFTTFLQRQGLSGLMEVLACKPARSLDRKASRRSGRRAA